MLHRLLAGIAGLGLIASAPLVAAQSQYRLAADVSAYYANDYQMTSPLFGLDRNGLPNTIYGSISYGSAYKTASAYDQTSAIPNVSIGGVWAGDASQGMTTVTANAYGMTDWGSNHASASLSGFTSVSQAHSGNYVDNMGVSWPMQINSQNRASAAGHSAWEELYQIGGGTGTGQFTGSVHIDGTLGPMGSSGMAGLTWSLTSFSGETVAAIYASYDAATDAWSKNVFSNGSWTGSTGSGLLALNEDVISTYSFAYGAALYLKSDLYTWVEGNGTADFSNTVQFTGMRLPQGAAVYVVSGAAAADYGISFAGDGSGTICDTLSCALAPVPEPSSYALLLAGLGVIGWSGRRHRQERRQEQH